MTVAPQNPRVESAQASTLRNGRWSGFCHLISARMKELRREPEVVFWMFVFPLLLSFGLGIAFRNRPADATSIAITSGPHAEDVLSLIQKSRKSAIRAEVVDRGRASQGLRLGKYDLVVEPVSASAVQYDYD